MSELIQLDSRKPLTRILAILAIVVTLIWGFFVVRWYLGNTLAEYFDTEQNSIDTAQLALSLAPSDPMTHWRLGDFTQKNLPPDQIGAAISEYEKAASLAPNDYRFWMTFGRALEQAGDAQRSEQALSRAVALAPSYAFPRWYLGNLLLRNERYPEAFKELQAASEADPELQPQLFNLAWEVFKDDIESLKSAAGSTAHSRAQFALYLVGRGRAEDGLKLWMTLSESEKRDNRPSAEAMVRKLTESFQFPAAVTLWNDIAPGPNYRAEIGRVLDGGFENDVSHGRGAAFGWQVPSLAQAQVAIDPDRGHSGSRSLRMVFHVRASLEGFKIAQTVPVKAGTEYEFECFVRTQKLESGATPVISILDAAEGVTLATSESAPTGTNDWRPVNLKFKTSPKTEAIILQITRPPCGENTVCPMFGTMWYDDFNLKSGS